MRNMIFFCGFIWTNLTISKMIHNKHAVTCHMSPVSFLPHTLPHSAHNSLIITCTCTMSAPSSSPAYKHTLLLCSLSGLLVSIQTTYLSTYLLRLLQRSSPAIYFSVSPVSPQSSIVCLFRHSSGFTISLSTGNYLT